MKGSVQCLQISQFFYDLILHWWPDKIWESPLLTDRMSFNSIFRRIQRLSAYTLSYRYIRHFLNNCVCGDHLDWRHDLLHLTTFTRSRHFWGAIVRTGWSFCRLCWLELENNLFLWSQNWVDFFSVTMMMQAIGTYRCVREGKRWVYVKRVSFLWGFRKQIWTIWVWPVVVVPTLVGPSPLQ